MNPAKGTAKKDATMDEDLSEEELALKQKLESYVEQILDPESEMQEATLEQLRQEMQTAASSDTFFQKYLMFLRPYYGALKEHFQTVKDKDEKELLADVLSVLALITCKWESLKYRLLGSAQDIHPWGCEYVRNLARHIVPDSDVWEEAAKHTLLGTTYCDLDRGIVDNIPDTESEEEGTESLTNLVEQIVCFHMKSEEEGTESLTNLVEQIVCFHMKQNAGPEAIDLFLEGLATYDMLHQHVDETNYKIACMYLTSAARYLSCDDDRPKLFGNACKLYCKCADYASALRVSLLSNDLQYVEESFRTCNDLLCKKQLCFILARHVQPFELDGSMVADEKDKKELQDIINNSKLSEGYLHLARDLEVMEPKTPEDVCKTHLLHGNAISSGGQRLAATFVNAFVNAGFGQDALMIVPSESSGDGFPRNMVLKYEEKASAVASLGMIFLWNTGPGLAQLDTYIRSEDNYAIAGALLGVGIVNSCIKSGNRQALVFLCKHLYEEEQYIRIGAIIGLGIAYANTSNPTVKSVLAPILQDSKVPLAVVAFTAISLGLVYLGTCDDDISDAIRNQLTTRSETELGMAIAKLLPLGLGILYLGKQETDSDFIEKYFSRLNEKIRKYCIMTVLSCAYAGSGNVPKVQYFLHRCASDLDESTTYQGPVVLGIAMIAMAEELGLEMAIRSFEHLLKYGEQDIRRAVPLALALLCISNPKANVIDTLSRLSHDSDFEVASVAIIALGLIGAGTNNTGIARKLENLSTFYWRNDDLLFCVRIAQGLLHLGKGLLTLNPYHSDRLLLSPTALAGLVIVLHACLEIKDIILGPYPFVLYFLALAMQPRMLMTVDENLNPLPVSVRVGRAVDAARAGLPKTITGSQTHYTPVILAAGERAELANEKYIPMSPILEGFVILKENPNYTEDH